MMQIKKKFLSLLLLLGMILCFPQVAMAQEQAIGWNQSDVADQKSVIEEQFTMPAAGAGIDFGLIAVNEYVYLRAMEIQEGVNVSPYADTINSLTPEEKELICRITYREAGNQPIEGQRAVMEVILNRLQSERWPDDVTTVLSSPGQFSTWKARHKVTNEQLAQMQLVLNLVYTNTNTILPNSEYVYFNCANPGRESIKIEQHWFWV